MGLTKYFSIPSDRMGAIWTLMPLGGGCVLEFGTSGTTRFALNTFARIQGQQNAKIYATHMDETDIAMGEVVRLEKALDELIREQSPSVVFMMPSTLSAVIGTDLEAYCDMFQEQYPQTKLLYVKNDGFRGNWTLGIEDTLYLLASVFPKEIGRTKNLTVNIIGSCADDYNYRADTKELLRILKEGFGAEVRCIMTSDTHIEDLELLGATHINLVLRKEGIKAAKLLEKRWSTPYVYGRPYGIQGTLDWLNQIAEVLQIPYNQAFVLAEIKEAEEILRATRISQGMGNSRRMVIGGPLDTVKGMRRFAEEEAGYRVVDAWCNAPEMGDDQLPFYEEKKWEQVVRQGSYEIIMGNAVALDLAKKESRKIQIDIPNYHFSSVNDPYTPYMGFRGAMYLVSLWTNPRRG